jgi:2C-methyl-D-erythritol 2,4-cyclodiphosphate synthase
MADDLRVGIGFDAHAFADGGRLVLAGVEVPIPAVWRATPTPI